MHQRADAFGFGTRKLQADTQDMKDLLKDTRYALQQISYYLKWIAEHQAVTDGISKPPPPTIEVKNG